MARFSVPYLKMRDGRPRWEPGPALRAGGWQGRDLRHDDGRWMDVGEAILAARAINDEVAAWRAAGSKKRAAAAPARPAHCCDALFAKWYASQYFRRKAARTKADYRAKARIFLETFGDAHVRAITKPHLVAAWEQWHDARGHHMACGILAVVSSALSYAEQVGWRPENSNPALNMRLPRPAARLALWLPAELEHIVATADAMPGLEAVGDAIVIALHSGQRAGDVFALPPRIFDGARIKLSQTKTGALVDAPMTPAVRARVEVIRRRQRQAQIASIATMIVDRRGKPHTIYSFNKAFRQVRQAAAEAMPRIADLRFQDLRDTAVTRLALADCTMPQIAAITGHSLPSITQIMRHYLSLQTEMADTAIDKLNTWMQEHDIAI